MGKGCIDLGLPTEAKPEWTISLDYTEQKEEKKEPEKKQVGSGSFFNDALDSDFLNNDFVGSPVQEFSRDSSGDIMGGALDEKITSFGSGESISGSGGDSLLGGNAGESLLGGGDDSLTTLGSGADSNVENDTIIGTPTEHAGDSDTIIDSKTTNTENVQEMDMSQQSTAAVQAVVEQFSASMQAVVQQLSATVNAVEHSAEHLEEHLEEVEQAAQNQSTDSATISSPQSEDVSPEDNFLSIDDISMGEINLDTMPQPEAEEVQEPVLSGAEEDVTASDEISLGEINLDTMPEPEAEEVQEPVLSGGDDTTHAGEAEKEIDEIEEKLTHLVNSMDNWEQSENALSEAAAMLSSEGKSLSEKENQDSQDDELRNLLERLEVSDSIDRMTATLQEDRADVIEQMQKDNDLQDAVEAVLVEETAENDSSESEIIIQDTEPELLKELATDLELTSESEETLMSESEPEPELTLEPEVAVTPEPEEAPEWTMDVSSEETLMSESEPEPELTLEPEVAVTPEPEETEPEPQSVVETLDNTESVAEPTEEPVMSSELEITNDMFDMGYDLSDEPEDYSDENIDLSQFKGSIEDADEFNAKSENSIDLDEAESNSSMDFDMSNLVAAAMSNLVANHSEENETFVETSASESIEEPESEPEANEGTLEFMTAEEPEVNESSLEAEPESEPEANEGTLEFMTAEELDEPEPEEASALTSDIALEFAASEEKAQETAAMQEPVMDTQQPEGEAEAKEWKADAEWMAQLDSSQQQEESIKMEFEPAYPNGEIPTLSGIVDDVNGDDIGSLIIEDYSEVPTVSDLEDKLKKHEKEKKKHKSKESHKKQEDGFAYSLDEIGSQLKENEPSSNSETSNSAESTDVVTEAIKVSEETVAATKTESPVEDDTNSVITTVYAKQNIRKIGKIKRTYFSLFFK